MNPAFLLFANTVLLTRLFVLFKDDVVAARPWVIKTVVELAALFSFYEFSKGGCGVAIIVVAANGLGWRWESKARRRKNLGRLAIGMVELVCLSFFFSPMLALPFRSGLAGAAQFFHDF